MNIYYSFIQKPPEVLLGSGLIVPRVHSELSSLEWQAAFDLFHQVKALLDKGYKQVGNNLVV